LADAASVTRSWDNWHHGQVKPVVFLDVDGPLNPFAAKPKPPGFVEHKFKL
jgi:hypothetical protein